MKGRCNGGDEGVSVLHVHVCSYEADDEVTLLRDSGLSRYDLSLHCVNKYF